MTNDTSHTEENVNSPTLDTAMIKEIYKQKKTEMFYVKLPEDLIPNSNTAPTSEENK